MLVATDRVRHSVHRMLDQLQYGRSPERFVIYDNAPIGLGGQITGKMHALMMGLASGRRVLCRYAGYPPYGAPHAPISDEGAPVGLDFDDLPLFSLAETRRYVSHDPLRSGFYSNNADVLAAIMSQLGEPVPPLALEGMILSWLRYTDRASNTIAAAGSRLGVGPDTLGVHLRRGDKQVETAFVPAWAINEAIAVLLQRYQFTSVFLASDSPSAASEIQVPAGTRLIFDSTESRHNNSNHKMLIDRPHLAEQETDTAIKNIGLLSMCGGIVGQSNAHFSTLAAAAVVDRYGDLDRLVLVSGDLAEKNDPVLRWVFQTKRRARSLAKRLLPWLRAKERIKRSRPSR